MGNHGNHTLINQISGRVDYITPPYIINKVKRVLREIDLDVASFVEANKIVGARAFFSSSKRVVGRQPDALPIVLEESVALKKDTPWKGSVWMNPPFQRSEVTCRPNCGKDICKKRGYHIGEDAGGTISWCIKFIEEFGCGNMTKGAAILFSNTASNWYQMMMDHCSCAVILGSRVNYMVVKDGQFVSGSGAPKDSTLFFFGALLTDVRTVFAHDGIIVAPWSR